MVRIYLAGPLFNAAERLYNTQIRDELAKFGHELVLPQENGIEIDAPRMYADKEYAIETAYNEYNSDLDLIRSCDALLINLDGITTDSGACVELGYAMAYGIPCYAIQTDSRKGEFGLCANMMVIGAVKNRVFGSVGELAKIL